MPGLPELPIKAKQGAAQTEVGAWDDSDKWQQHRGPKPKPEPRGTIPLAWLEDREGSA